MQEGKTEFLFIPSRVLRGEDTRTTLMIKNIPNRVTKDELAEMISKTHAGAFDFIHMPLDRRSGSNVGYAFINFASHHSLLSFWQTWNSRAWAGHANSAKRCELSYAQKQFVHGNRRL